MPTPVDSATLILRLYEMRREPRMREARDWFTFTFFPASVDDVLAVWLGSESASFRMVTSHWEMVAAFVTHGAIGADLFHAANTEHLAVYLKLAPFLAELRTRIRQPSYLGQLEALMALLPVDDGGRTSMQRHLEHVHKVGVSAPTAASAPERR